MTVGPHFGSESPIWALRAFHAQVAGDTEIDFFVQKSFRRCGLSRRTFWTVFWRKILKFLLFVASDKNRRYVMLFLTVNVSFLYLITFCSSNVLWEIYVRSFKFVLSLLEAGCLAVRQRELFGSTLPKKFLRIWHKIQSWYRRAFVFFIVTD